MGARGPVPRLTRQVKVRLDRALYAQIHQGAAAAGMGVGAYVRAVLADHAQDHTH